MVMGMDLLDTALEAGIAIYMIDAVTGKRKKVYVKNQAEADRLRAKNKALRAKLAKKKTKSGNFRKPAKKTTTRKKSTKKKLWWE